MQKLLLTILFFTTTLFILAQQQPRLVLPVEHTSTVNSASFSRDGKYFVTASYDNTARIWEVSSGKELNNLQGHEGNAISASFSSKAEIRIHFLFLLTNL